jgi:hypothetical protein
MVKQIKAILVALTPIWAKAGDAKFSNVVNVRKPHARTHYRSKLRRLF